MEKHVYKYLSYLQVILITCVLIGFAKCGRLDNIYLPANQRYISPAPSKLYSPKQYNAGSYSTGSFPKGQQVPILKLEDNNSGDGTYSYAYETGNGIAAQEHGDARGEGTRAQGGFSYTSPEGEHVQIQYTGGEEGFQATGSHIPVAPPIPEAIAKSIEQNLAEEASGVIDDGQYRSDGAGQYRQATVQYRTSGTFGGNAQYNPDTSGYKY